MDAGELFDRTLADGTVIKVRTRQAFGVFQAELLDNPAVWEAGDTRVQAVERLARRLEYTAALPSPPRTGASSMAHLGSEDADLVDAVGVGDPLGRAVAGGVGDQGDHVSLIFVARKVGGG